MVQQRFVKFILSASCLGLLTAVGMTAFQQTEASAQMTPAMAEKPVQPEIPRFTPVTRWDIGSTAMATDRGLAGMSLPCVMKAGYDNGFVVRFAGGGNKILSMAIDFRQKVFQQGKVYQAKVTLGKSEDTELSAQAFSPSVLIFDTTKISNFHGFLRAATIMRVTVDGTSLDFKFNGMGGALKELEGCYGGAENRAQIADGVQAATAAVPENRVSRELKIPDLDAERPILPKPMSLRDPVPAPVPPSDLERQNTQQPVFMSPKTVDPGSNISLAYGDGYKAPLPDQFNDSRPSLLEGRVSQSMRDDTPVSQVEKSFATVPAVKMPAPVSAPVPVQVPAQAPVSVSAADHSGDWTQPVSRAAPQPVRVASLPVSQSVVAPQPLVSDMNQVWEAKAGADMKTVMQQWASRAGIELNWQADHTSRVIQDVYVTGSFEQAVEILMAQNAAVYGLEADMQADRVAAQSISTAGSTAGLSDIARARISRPVDSGQGDSLAWQGSMGASSFTAVAGADLRQVLSQWAAQEGASFEWLSSQSFGIKQTVQSSGAFEDALMALLSQYETDASAPQAELNIDPQTGGKSLTVR